MKTPGTGSKSCTGDALKCEILKEKFDILGNTFAQRNEKIVCTFLL